MVYIPCPEPGPPLGCRRCPGTMRSGRLDHELVALDVGPLLTNLCTAVALAAAQQRGKAR
jgi:hypothetical protein